MIKNIIQRFQRNKWRNYMNAHYVGGHWFYTYKNVMYLHNRRQFLFQMALKNNEYGVSYEELAACTSLIKNALQTNDIGKAFTYINTLETYMSMPYNMNNLFKLCDSIILMDKEPELNDNEEWTLKKRQVFDNSDEVKGFFFAHLQDMLTAIGKLSEGILIVDYMRKAEVQRIDSLFLNMISDETSSNTTPQ